MVSLPRIIATLTTVTNITRREGRISVRPLHSLNTEAVRLLNMCDRIRGPGRTAWCFSESSLPGLGVFLLPLMLRAADRRVRDGPPASPQPSCCLRNMNAVETAFS